MELMRSLLRTYTPGRRARFNQEAEDVKDKLPSGVVSGIIIRILPLLLDGLMPRQSELEGEPPTTCFGLEIEFDGPSGLDSIVLRTEDVILDPFDLGQLRRELLHRLVRFARSSGIGIDFPVGAADDGLIKDVRLRQEDDGLFTDVVVSLRIEVDPFLNPEGLHEFLVDADFTQCQLQRRLSPPMKK
jgi:hypothetical protein